MPIKMYRLRIEGYVVHQSFGEAPAFTPADMLPSQIVEAMGADIQVTERLIDTIDDPCTQCHQPIEVGTIRMDRDMHIECYQTQEANQDATDQVLSQGQENE